MAVSLRRVSMRHQAVEQRRFDAVVSCAAHWTRRSSLPLVRARYEALARGRTFQ